MCGWLPRIGPWSNQITCLRHHRACWLLCDVFAALVRPIVLRPREIATLHEGTFNSYRQRNTSVRRDGTRGGRSTRHHSRLPVLYPAGTRVSMLQKYWESIDFPSVMGLRKMDAKSRAESVARIRFHLTTWPCRCGFRSPFHPRTQAAGLIAGHLRLIQFGVSRRCGRSFPGL